jgi:hypothetical protein
LRLLTTGVVLEQRAVSWLTKIVHEGDTSLEGDLLTKQSRIDQSQAQRLIDLSVVVVRLLAQQLRICNAPWPTVQIIGESLNLLAIMLEEDVIRPSLYTPGLDG